MTILNNDHYRSLLDELRRGIAARQEQERALAEAEAAKDSFSSLTVARETEALDAEEAAAEAAAAERFAAETARLNETFEAETAAATAEFEQSEHSLQQQLEAALTQLNKAAQDDTWLVSSVLDDKSENSPLGKFKRLQAQIDRLRDRLAVDWTEVQATHAKTKHVLKQCRQPVEVDIEPSPAARDREQALQRFEEAVGVTRAYAAALSQEVLPRLFSNQIGPIVWTALFVLLSGGLLVAFSPGTFGLPARNPWEWPLIVSGVSLVLTGLLAGIVYLVSTSRTATLLEPLEQAMSDAALQYEAWQRLADAELTRAENAYVSKHASIVERREESIRRADLARQQGTQAAQSEYRQAWLQIQQQRDALIETAQSRHRQAVRQLETSYRGEQAVLKARFKQERQRRAQEWDSKQGQQSARQRQLATELIRTWRDTVSRLELAQSAARQENSRLFSTWDDLAAAGWQPPRALPEAIRLGEWQAPLSNFFSEPPAVPREGDSTTVTLPAVLPAPSSPSLLLKAAGEGKSVAVTVIQEVMLRLLTQFPPGDVRFTILDPVGLGENFSAFMHLADADELLISSRIWTEPAHIEKQLAVLQEHIENVFQKYLRNDFTSIEEYNQHAGEVAEPYHFLIVANFPTSFSERAAQRLRSIVTSGARCGVHTIMSLDSRQPLPRELDAADLEAAMTVLEWNGSQFVTKSLGQPPLQLVIDPPPPPSQLVSIIRRVGELSRHVRKVEVPFHRITPREDAYWKGDSRYGIEVPLGRAGATKLQSMRLGPGTSQHVLVAGKTGSGKSTLLHVAITNLALRYSPDELEFYLVDFKKGVEFKTYAEHNLPHARVIAVESDREFGTSTLERLDAILKERGDLFRKHGVQDVGSLRNSQPQIRMPRILLIVDEFQEFFVEDDQHSQTAALLLDRLVRQGRAFGIHVLLGSQTLGGAYSLARTTLGQMAVRIALQCSEADAHLILSEDNTAARLLTRPGEALYNDANGMIEGNSPFQIAWLSDEERDLALSRVHQLAAEQDQHWPDPIVFEGNVPADPLRNERFCELMESLDNELTREEQDHPRTVWLGEAVAITGPTHVEFPRRSGTNLLIVGQDRGAARGLLANALAALSAQAAQAAARGVIGSSTSSPENGEEAIPPSGVWFLTGDGAISPEWNPVLGVLPTDVVSGGPSDVAETLKTIAAEVTRRQTAGPGSPLFLMIDNLSRFRDLRKGDDDYGFGGFDKEKTVSPSQSFTEILKEGPAVGVHVIVWCDSYNNVDRWLSRQSLREFEMRVTFQMSSADSSHLLDSPAASRLGVNRAILYSDERGTLEKFRPYGPPTEEWLDTLKRRGRPAEDAAIEIADDLSSWVVT